jgi:DNA-binding MarR family transcriptional regulator
MELPSSLLMFISQRHAESRIVEHLRANGFDDLTIAQGRIAARIGEGGSRITELAEQAQITKQTAGFLVNQLEKAGYVERVPDPSDARARLVRLAPRGHQAQACAREMERVVEAEWAARLGPRRMQAMREALADLREITDPFL